MFSWLKSLFSWMWSSDPDIDPIQKFDESLGKIEGKLDQAASIKERAKALEDRVKRLGE